MLSNNEKLCRGKGKIIIRKSGKLKTGHGGYNTFWLYIPSKIGKDSSFSFNDREEVNVELKDGNIIVSKRNDIIELINEYGMKNATLPKLIEQKAKKNKEKILIYYKDESYSYREVHEFSNRIAHGIIKILKELNLKKPKIALILPNKPEFFFYWFGIVKSGCIFVPVNPFLEGESLEYIINHSDSEILILDYKFLEKFNEIRSNLPKIQKVIIINAPINFNFDGIYVDYQDIFTDNIEVPKVTIKNIDPMEIIYTEGTTGRPKGIVYRNYHVLTGLILSEEAKRYGHANVIYFPFPLYHAFAQNVIFLPIMFYNAAIAIAEKFDVSNFWKDMKKYKAELFGYYGSILQDLLNQPPSNNDRNHPVKWGVGIFAPKELWEVFENRFGVTLYEGWGSTEAICLTVNILGSKEGKVGSVGEPIFGFDVKIVDSEGNEMPYGPDNIGEIIVKGKFNIPLEYYKSPKSNIMTLGKNGYYYTEDLGYKDKDGYLYYMGRKTDLIKKNGMTFTASIIENMANTHPNVLNSAAFKVPGKNPDDPDIKICVILKKNRKLTHEELYSYLSENLAYFMVPRYIEFKDKLRSSSERIKKYILRNEWTNTFNRKRTWDSKIGNYLNE